MDYRIRSRSHFANIKAFAASPDDARSPMGTCPLMMSTVQLLPVRYGLVESLEPSADVNMPYRLKAHPLGFRLLRKGFLYVIDSVTQRLQEFSTEHGLLHKLLFRGSEVTAKTRLKDLDGEPKLIFRRNGHLHVAYSEVRWTPAKCNLMLTLESEREYFMQRVELPKVGEQNPPHLFFEQEIKQWLGEVTLSRDWSLIDTLVAQNNDPAYEYQRPYPWEHAPCFRHTIIEELTGMADVEHHYDCLVLAVRDDIGVMRDLAHYQDQVIGQIEDWARSGTEQGQVERDYVLSCYIESLTQISAADLASKAKAQPALQALLDDLEQLPEPQRSQTHQTLLEILSEDISKRPPDASHADLQVQLNRIRTGAIGANAYDIQRQVNQTRQHYYLAHRFVGNDPDFLARHRPILWQLYQQQDWHIRGLLYGARFGQRGINDLIDRPAMDAFLAEQRATLQTLNDLLDRITDDRLQMLTENRFHRAAWYYDIEDQEQVEHALFTEYACLKDICRSDDAHERILAWLNDQPEFSRPMFYALPRSVQTELAVQLAFFTNTGWQVFSHTTDRIEKFQAWGQGLVLDVDKLPSAMQITATAAWHALSPALQTGMHQATQGFLQGLNHAQMPDIEELFRRMPKAAWLWILDAARRERVTFQVGDASDIKALGETIRKVQEMRRDLRAMTNYLQQSKATDPLWHQSESARSSRNFRRQLQVDLKAHETRLAAAMRPISDLPVDAIHLQEANGIKPGLALVFPPEQQVHVRSLLDSYRRGVAAAPIKARLGDGVGLLVFFAQLVNLAQVYREMNPEDSRLLLITSVAATAASGFGAAQAIADTALTAYAAKLTANLQRAELRGVQVQMGKLHVSLGGVGYAAGLLAAGISLNSSSNNWEDAVRRGNAEAQAGAMVSIMGSAGFLGSNAYGLGQTVLAFNDVLATQRHTPARLLAWAAAGTRLSTVFLRFNVVGILFTALELSGTWLYNRYNLTLHDLWLQTTPWGQDLDKRQPWSLMEYQDQLRRNIQAPRIEIIPATTDDQGQRQPKQYLLHFPTLSASELNAPLGLNNGNTLLRLGGYLIVGRYAERDFRPDRWSPLDHHSLQDHWRVQQTDPLTLQLSDITRLAEAYNSQHRELMLTLELLYRRPDGVYSGAVYTLRFPVNGASGIFPSRDQAHQGEDCQLFTVIPAHLPEVGEYD